MKNLLKKIKPIFEDNDILVINKPAGVIVNNINNHPAPCLIDWLKKRGLANAKPAHRLDKDTTGALVIAKNFKSLNLMQHQFRMGKVFKEYRCLVVGKIKPQGIIKVQLARDPRRKSAMRAVIYPTGRERGKLRATKTTWRVLNFFDYGKIGVNYLQIKIFTGRTHQIRASFKYLGNPVIGDKMYYNKVSKRLSKQLGVKRQMLHSYQLSFKHPANKKLMKFLAPLAVDLKKTLEILINEQAEN